MQWIIGLLLAGGIGVSLGLLGGGGSVLALPVLVYVMGVAPKSAIAMTLVIVGSVSLLGLIPHWRVGNIHLRTAVVFGSATMLGAFTGAKIATLPVVSEAFQMLLFAAMMLLAAGFMIYRSARSIQPDDPLPLYPKPICKYCWLWLLTEGLVVGVLTGLVGVGGGFAIVPVLVLLAKIPMKQAIGTSLLIIAANSVAGFLGYLGQVSLDWHFNDIIHFRCQPGNASRCLFRSIYFRPEIAKSLWLFFVSHCRFCTGAKSPEFSPFPRIRKSGFSGKPLYLILKIQGWVEVT